MQINPNIDPKVLFNKNNIKRYIFLLLSFIFVFSFILIYTAMSLYRDVVADYTYKLSTIDKTEGLDINLMCNVVSCKYLINYTNKDIDYYENNNILIL